MFFALTERRILEDGTDDVVSVLMGQELASLHVPLPIKLKTTMNWNLNNQYFKNLFRAK